MTAGIWTETVRVRSYDVTPRGTASVLALADYFQEAEERFSGRVPGQRVAPVHADGVRSGEDERFGPVGRGRREYGRVFTEAGVDRPFPLPASDQLSLILREAGKVDRLDRRSLLFAPECGAARQNEGDRQQERRKKPNGWSKLHRGRSVEFRRHSFVHTYTRLRRCTHATDLDPLSRWPKPA